MPSVHVLYDGYSFKEDEKFFANCTCTLIKGQKNIIVDCMTAWDRDKVVEGLARHDLTPSMIDFAIATHGHSDHLGNLNLFLNAVHVVGFTVSRENQFFDHPFTKDVPYIIDEDITIVPTPGHTSDDISVIVMVEHEDSQEKKLTYAVAGDVFEREEDILNPALWKEQSSDPQTQVRSRYRIACKADVIVPGHGPMFKVTPGIREQLKAALNSVEEL